MKFARAWLVVAAAMAVLSGCSESKAPDVAMTTSPSGLWVGKSNPDVGLEIQDDGSIKITRAGREQMGTWKASGTSAIQAEFNSQAFDMPFTRKDLELEIVLPGETKPSTFTQM
ncbi:MAG: hypothetical protein SFX74_05430 [Fimbriimonadaceae bacterium]|nr:hypothetical protein [Fimbriimonadaceae bacterium]